MPFHSDKAIYVDAEGNVVDADDPNVHEMVVAAGGTISDKVAARYGLAGAVEEPTAETAEASADPKAAKSTAKK